MTGGRVARDFFASLDTYEEEGIPGTLGNAQVGADRSQQVRRKNVIDRDEIALFSEALKFAEVRLDHGISSQATVYSSQSKEKETYYYITSGRPGLFVRG